MKKIICSIIFVLSIINPINIFADEDKPEVTSDYVYMYDIDTKQVLWDKNSNEKIYPASMTKMMTLIVALENIDNVEERIIIEERMLKGLKEANATVAGFSVNENPKIIDLMYGVMLPSGGDCTNALAYHISGSIDGFVNLMNEKAKQLNMSNTHFENATGLHNDNHYTTLKDLSLLLDYCIKNETFVKIFSTSKYTSSSTNINPNGIVMNSTVFKNINNSNGNVKIDGFVGGKTGYTNQARYCLASVVENNGIKYGLITAHAWINKETLSHSIDAGIIYNYFINNYHKETIYTKDELIKKIPVYYNFKNSNIDIKIKDDVSRIIKNNTNYEVQVNLPSKLYAPIKKDEKIGNLNVLYNGNILYSTDLYADKTIKKDFILFIFTNIYWFIISHKILSMFILILLFLFIFLIYLRSLIIKRRRKNRKRKKQIVNYL